MDVGWSTEPPAVEVTVKGANFDTDTYDPSFFPAAH